MTTAEILEKAADHIEKTQEKDVIGPLYIVTEYKIDHWKNRLEAESLIRKRVSGSLYEWAMNSSVSTIANTLRSIAREAA